MHSTFFIWFVAALWIALVLYLTITAFQVRKGDSGHMGQRFLLLFAIIAAFVLPRLKVFHFVNFAPVKLPLSLIGTLLSVAGMAFLVWGRIHLGKNWSQIVTIKENHKLVTSGPYRYVRHPMYGGGIVACFGSAIVIGGPFVFLLLILGMLFLERVRAEDELLAHHFPDEYPEYHKRTKALIPFVW